jgi:hypothetical protein
VRPGTRKGDTGLKKERFRNDFDGFPIFHNIREHEAIDGRPPAEAAGIVVEIKSG